jgi:hypothetical protein
MQRGGLQALYRVGPTHPGIQARCEERAAQITRSDAGHTKWEKTGKRRDACSRRPLFFSVFLSARAGGQLLGKHRLAGPDQQVLTYLRSKCFLFLLQSDKLSFQVPYALLETAHFGDHPEIGPADVAE